MTFLGLSYWAWVLLCLGVALLYAFIGPEPRSHAAPLRAAVRWLHSGVWLLLATAATWVAVTSDTSTGRTIAMGALITYVAWLASLGADRVAAGRD